MSPGAEIGGKKYPYTKLASQQGQAQGIATDLKCEYNLHFYPLFIFLAALNILFILFYFLYCCACLDTG